MILGHGIIDYIVVLLCVVFAAYLLLTRPQHLLVFLPTMVSIDFFIPFISQLTPGRLVPLVIAGWWFYLGKSPFRQPVGIWLKMALAIMAISTLVAMSMQDSGLRPLIRALNYLNLVILCGFVWQFGRNKLGTLKLFQGFALAGLIHGAHCIYQLIAVRVGLPFRGIIYSAEKAGASLAGSEIGGFRINGFADEPKRLGLVLLAGIIGLLFLAARQHDPTRKHVMQGIAVMLLLLSFLTYSSSYLIALVLWLPVFLLFTQRGRKYTVWLAAIAVVIGIFAATPVANYVTTQEELFESRERELEEGIEATMVYRQELFAEDYLKLNPMTAVSGVGMGRYYEVFNRNYGMAAGMGLYGDLLPLNSQFFELMYDTGLPGLLLVYVGCMVVYWKVRRHGLAGFMLGAIILFQVIQSFFVQSLPMLMLATGGALAFLQYAAPAPVRVRRRTKPVAKPPTARSTDATVLSP